MIRVLACALPALAQEIKRSSNVDVLSPRGVDAMADLLVSVFLPGHDVDEL